MSWLYVCTTIVADIQVKPSMSLNEYIEYQQRFTHRKKICKLFWCFTYKVFVLNQTANGAQLFQGGWRSSAHSSWIATTIMHMSNSPTCPASPLYGSTRTKSATFLLLWRRSAANFQISSEFFFTSCISQCVDCLFNNYTYLVIYLFGFTTDLLV